MYIALLFQHNVDVDREIEEPSEGESALRVYRVRTL